MEPQSSSTSSGDAPASRALAGVLRKALIEPAESHSPDASNPFVIAAQNVARRYSGKPMAAEPILCELVLEIIVSYYGISEDRRQQWEHVAAMVASSLFDDPAAHERLDNLWRRLCQLPV